MEKEIIIKHKLFNEDISQNCKSEYFSATDLIRAGNIWRSKNDLDLFNLANWLRSKSAKVFIKSLEESFGKVKIDSKGKGYHTWVHPFLFIDIALAINPKLKVEVYSWLFDYLLNYNKKERNSAYKKVCGALFYNSSSKSEFPKYIITVNNILKTECKVKDWQTANQNQLKLRDRIHENIALFCDVLKDNKQAVKLGILKAVGNKEK